MGREVLPEKGGKVSGKGKKKGGITHPFPAFKEAGREGTWLNKNQVASGGPGKDKKRNKEGEYTSEQR